MDDLFRDRSILVTGGTGSFGRRLVAHLLAETPARRVIVFSRDELKQWEMGRAHAGEDRLRFFLGDVRDLSRLLRALDGVDLVVHAAALKQVVALEYNPFEAVKTNILGSQNVIDAAIERGVRRVVALSTDKACSPISLYGATKLVSDKLFVDGNAYAGAKRTRFAVVRYGNLVGSRGSIVPLFRELAPGGVLPITDERMTRFWTTLDTAVRFVVRMLGAMEGGEIFVPKTPSMRVVDLARALAPEARLEVIGVRPGEKLHEELISVHDAPRTLDCGDHYSLRPDMPWQGERPPPAGQPVAAGFRYNSADNDRWLDVAELQRMAGDVS